MRYAEAIKIGAKFIQYPNTIGSLASSFAELFSNETSWNVEFSKVFGKQIINAAFGVHMMRETLRSMKEKIEFVIETIADK